MKVLEVDVVEILIVVKPNAPMKGVIHIEKFLTLLSQ